ncbi:MAG: helix-turn-helix domain-containing protein [Oscillospiraceae bacterium]|nr:helix-turn-helix domain-containing protein [Oscillospiraceae bacterium]
MTEQKRIPRMCGIDQIAEMFGISRYYARQLALSGKVAAVRVGRGKILVNADSVAAFFDDARIGSESQESPRIIPIPRAL